MGPVALVHDPADVHVDQDSEGFVSVVNVQACCALTAATRALIAAILLCMLSCFSTFGFAMSASKGEEAGDKSSNRESILRDVDGSWGEEDREGARDEKKRICSWPNLYILQLGSLAALGETVGRNGV